MQQERTIEVKDPPVVIDVEQRILGNIINNDKLIADIIDVVKISAFFLEEHQEIYRAMLYLHNSNQKIGYSTLLNRLKFKELDDEITNYALTLTQGFLREEDFDTDVGLLVDTYQKRVLYNLYKKRIQTDLGGIASANLVKEVEGAIDNMGITSNIEYERFEDYIDEWLAYQEDDTVIDSMKLGFEHLDDLLLLEDSNLLLIGARPSVGKSAFATNLVKNFCIQGKHPLFISLEMNRREFMNRLVSNMAHVKAEKLKRKLEKDEHEWSRIMMAKDKIGSYKFNFYDKGGMKIEQLVGLARYLKKQGELDVIVVDYLQLLETNQYRGQKQNQVSYVSQKLKQIAMELHIPVVALSQLSRAVIESDGTPREPQLADLRDSGSLEQDANIVIMLHTVDTEQKFDSRFIDLFVRKNRDGRLGKIKYIYEGDYVNFKEAVWDKDKKRFVALDYDFESDIKQEDDLPF